MPALQTNGLTKSFSGVLAVDNFSFSVEKGEVHALVGENGAGKSTLVKMLSGVYPPSSGSFSISGKELHFKSPRDAAPYVGVVYQDRDLVPHFNGCENIFLGLEEGVLGFLNKKKMKDKAREYMNRYGIEIDLDTPVLNLSGGQQQMLALLKVIYKNPGIVILDEPTAPLSVKECKILFSLIADLKLNGTTIIYISHHLSEVLSVSDRVTVMRNGSLVATENKDSLDETALIKLMISRDIGNQYPKKYVNIGDEIFRVNEYEPNSSRGKRSSFNIRSGEIVGFAGLVGSGRTELAKGIFTGAKHESGEIKLAQSAFISKSPRESIEKGIVMIPENRREEGLITDMTVSENITYPELSRWTSFGLIKFSDAAKAASEVIRKYAVKAFGLEQAVKTLSGGNQQKVSIGKWDNTNAKVWIFDEPTQGIDVDAKTEVYSIMCNLAESGAGVWFISSEMRELLAISDRIYVMKDGGITAEYSRPFDSENILSSMMMEEVR